MFGKMFSISLVLSLLACTAIYQTAKPLPTGHEKPTSTTRVRLDPLRAVFVTIPGDGESASVWCLGSGRAAAQAITAAFAKQGIPVYVAEEQLAREEALLAAARLKAGYVALSVITLWDQRNEWLGRPSSVAVRVSIVDVATGRVIESKPIVTHNRTQLAFTIVSPETLLEKSLNEYVSKFY
jgi:hypothetical protein